MISRSALLTIFVLLFAAASFGQISVNLYNVPSWAEDENGELIWVDAPLTDACIGGLPLLDGTPILIFHDIGLNGPSANDYQPVVGSNLGNVNYNTFSINGDADPDYGPGHFLTVVPWASVGERPSPRYFYLLVCADTMHYYSNTFEVSGGVEDFYFFPEAYTEDTYFWTCVDGPCDVCLPPARPTGLTATSNLASGIRLNWNHNGVDIGGFRIRRDGELLDTLYVPPLAPPFEYLDATATNGPHTYQMTAFRICDDGSWIFSQLSAPVTGTRIPGPPVPILQYVSTDSCGSIYARVLMNTVQGLTELRIYRVIGTDPPVLIETITNAVAGQPIIIEDENPPVGPACYYAVGWSTVGGEGTASATICGEAHFAPACTPVITSVSTTICDRITIAWTYACTDADSFRIRRNTTVVATVAASVLTYDDMGTLPGVTTGYAIIPVNECGPGTASTPMTGRRAAAPVAVTGVNTTGRCNGITVGWTLLTGEITEYKIYRNNALIGTVASTVNTYPDNDPTLAPGIQYAYNVTGSNVCGEGAHSANVNGSLLPQNTGGATLALASAGPPNWDYSLTWVSGCVSRLMIRDLCPGTTGGFIGTGWTVTTYTDSVVWVADNPLDAGATTGFRLTNSSGCAGTGRYTAGGGEGSIEGPLPVGRVFEVPKEYALSVYPNPFNPATTLEFALPKAGMVHVNVYNIVGRLVSEVVSGDFEAGYHKVNFDATSLPSGLYFARINSRDFVTTKKLMLVK